MSGQDGHTFSWGQSSCICAVYNTESEPINSNMSEAGGGVPAAGRSPLAGGGSGAPGPGGWLSRGGPPAAAPPAALTAAAPARQATHKLQHTPQIYISLPISCRDACGSSGCTDIQ